MKQDALRRCPLCDANVAVPFLHRSGVPVHQNLVFADAEDARAMARGDLLMCVCAECGFGFNDAFDPSLLDYGQQYDNSQNWSPAFDAYMDGLVRDLVEKEEVRNSRIVEVGCGKGTFLRKLISYPGGNNTGYGFDPSYAGPLDDLDGRVRFQRAFLNEASRVSADAVVCRHVIEHIENPVAFLSSVRAGLTSSPGVKVFFETPCLEWILRNQVVWDFFYEHCSLFTAASLASALTRAGYGDISNRHVFGGQYLWTKGTLTGPNKEPLPSASILRLAEMFARNEEQLQWEWQKLVQSCSRKGAVAVWGAGAKGVTFCNLVDPERRFIERVIDVNPAKHGKFLPGTGHPILHPEKTDLRSLAAVIVLNPSYTREIERQLSRHPTCAVLDAMQAREQNLCA